MSPSLTIRSTFVLALIIAAVGLAVAWGAWQRAARGRALAEAAVAPANPRIPAPAHLDELDPDIVRVVRRGLADVSRRREDAAAWRDLGMVYDAHDMPQLAAECYARAVELRPSDLRTWYHLAVVAGELGRVEQACDAMQRAIELHAGYGPAHDRLGFWRLSVNDLPGAERAFVAAGDLPGDDPIARIGLARVRLRQQRWPDAIELLEPLAGREDANAAHARQLLARAYRATGRQERASDAAAAGFGPLRWSDEWRDAVESRRVGLTTSLRETGRALAGGRTAEAVEQAERLAREHPGDVALLTAAATTLRMAGNLDRAESMLRGAVDDRPGYYPAHLELARTLATRQEDAGLGEAMEHVDRALVLNPSLAPAHALRGELLLRSGDAAAAAAAFGQAARCDPAEARYALQAGVAAVRHADWTAAIGWLESYTRQRPDSARGLHLLAVAYLNAGRVAAAAESLDRAEALDPYNDEFQATRRRIEQAGEPR